MVSNTNINILNITSFSLARSLHSYLSQDIFLSFTHTQALFSCNWFLFFSFQKILFLRLVVNTANCVPARIAPGVACRPDLLIPGQFSGLTDKCRLSFHSSFYFLENVKYFNIWMQMYEFRVSEGVWLPAKMHFFY